MFVISPHCCTTIAGMTALLLTDTNKLCSNYILHEPALPKYDVNRAASKRPVELAD